MTFDALNRAAILATTALLGVGLGVWVVRGEIAAARLLDAGLMALILTPVLRLITTLVEDVRRRDGPAVAATLAVAAILGLTLAVALRF
jgi:uncharacterized membrane protein